jgi:hypothetical protein
MRFSQYGRVVGLGPATSEFAGAVDRAIVKAHEEIRDLKIQVAKLEAERSTAADLPRIPLRSLREVN